MSHSAVRTGIIAVIVLLGSAVIFGSMVLQIRNKEILLHEQITILAKHRDQQNTFFELRKTAEETTGSRATLQQLFFLRGSDSVDFLNEVESLAPKTGVTVETESLTELSDDEADTQWLEMSFSINGAEADVQRFIQLLENLPYALRLTKLTVTERSSAVAKATVTLQVRLLQYES